MKRKVPKTTITMIGFIALIVAACGSGADDDEGAPASDGSAATDDAEAAEPADDGNEGPGEPERTSIRLAFQAPDFNQIASFKFVQNVRDAGIEVEFTDYQDDSILTRALLAEEADFAVASALSTIIRANETSSEKLVMVGGVLQRATFVLVGQPEIESLEDFAQGGMQIGISTPGDLSDVFTRYMMTEAGIDNSLIEYVSVGGTSARMTAVLNNQLDAGPAHFAEGLTAARDGNKRVIARYADYLPPYQGHTLFASEETIAQNPNLTQILVDAMIDAARWARDNKDEYIALAEEALEAPPDADIMDEAYDEYIDVELFAVNGGLDEDLLQSTIAIEQAAESLGDDIPPSNEWANDTFVNSYLERFGSR